MRLNGVEIRCTVDRDVLGRTGYRMIPPADFPRLRPLDFFVAWDAASEDERVLDVIDLTARAAVERSGEPDWWLAYCGRPA